LTPHDKIALVTGGSRGIGRAIAVALAGGCAHTVIINYLENDAAAAHTSETVEACGARCEAIKANLLFPSEIDGMFAEIKANFGKIDILVHCAALGAFKPLLDIKPNQWDLSFNVNARAFLLCIQKALPLMDGGSIIAISSLGARAYVPNYGAIGPSKAALEALIRSLAVELAPRGIRVNGISAGFIETDSIKKFPDSEYLLEKARLRTPMQRLGVPEDLAGIALFLCADAARWICGQVIVADGGLSLL
jgi:enoyl-[acyl-carrier protein] reductase III